MKTYLRDRLEEPRIKTVSFRTTETFKSRIDTYCKKNKITQSEFMETTLNKELERKGI